MPKPCFAEQRIVERERREHRRRACGHGNRHHRPVDKAEERWPRRSFAGQHRLQRRHRAGRETDDADTRRIDMPPGAALAHQLERLERILVGARLADPGDGAALADRIAHSLADDRLERLLFGRRRVEAIFEDEGGNAVIGKPVCDLEPFAVHRQRDERTARGDHHRCARRLRRIGQHRRDRRHRDIARHAAVHVRAIGEFRDHPVPDFRDLAGGQ